MSSADARTRAVASGTGSGIGARANRKKEKKKQKIKKTKKQRTEEAEAKAAELEASGGAGTGYGDSSKARTASFARALRYQLDADTPYDEHARNTAMRHRSFVHLSRCLVTLRIKRPKQQPNVHSLEKKEGEEEDLAGQLATLHITEGEGKEEKKRIKKEEEKEEEEEVSFWEYFIQGRIAQLPCIRGLVTQLLAALKDPGLDEDTLYHTSLALDMCLPYWVWYHQYVNTKRPVDRAGGIMAHGWKDVIHQESIADHHATIMDTFYSKGAVTDTMRHHLLSKLHPRAGMARLFSKLAMDYKNSNRLFRVEMDRIMACSLLGNYRHAPAQSRAGLRLRMFVYSVLYPDQFVYPGSHMNRAIWDMLMRPPLQSLFLICMREYLVHHVADNPALEKHAKMRFDYDAFKKATIGGMAAIRQKLGELLANKAMLNESEVLCTVACKEASDKIRPWQRELHSVVKTWYELAKKTTYRRAKPDPCALLRSVKGRYPPVTAWATRARVKVYLRDPPRADEKCSSTRRRARLKKRKATDAMDIAGDDDSEDEDADDEGATGGHDPAVEADESGNATARPEDEAETSVQGSRDIEAIEAKLQADMVRKARDMFEREAKRADRARWLEEDDYEEERSRIQEERGMGGTEVEQAEVDQFGFTESYLAVLENEIANPEASGIVPNGVIHNKRTESLARYRAAREAAISAYRENGGTWPPEYKASLLPPEEFILSRSAGVLDPDAIPLTRDRICMVHDAMLRKCIPHIHPRAEGMNAFLQISECISHLGAPREGVDKMYKIAKDNDDGLYTEEEWKGQIREFRSQYPYTFDLFHAAATIRCTAPRLITEELPQHILVNQGKAIAQRYELLPYNSPLVPHALPWSASHLYYCGVCGMIYSIIQKIVRPGMSEYTHGFRNVHVDLTDMTLWCRRQRREGSLACADQPLLEVPSLGRLLYLRQRGYTLCPQPGCGMLFAISTYAAPANEYGLSCQICTAKMKSRRHMIPQVVIDLTQGAIRPSGALLDFDMREGAAIPPPQRCYKCDRAINLTRRVGIFGLHTFLCHRHTTRELVDDVRLRCALQRIPSEIDKHFAFDRDVRHLIGAYFRRLEEARQPLRIKRNRAMNKRYRANATAKRAR